MADWLTHSLIGWITGKTTKQDIALIIVGSLLPDLTKISLIFDWLGIYDYQIFSPLHTPIAAILVTGIIALFFINTKQAFLSLSIGFITHFFLDFFLVHTNGGMKLLFPFSWEGWQINVYRSDDYRVTILTVLAALIVYVIYWYHTQKKKILL